MLFAGNCDFNALSELRSLKARIEELESEIKEKDEEVKTLKESSSQKLTNGGTEDSSEAVKVSLFFCWSEFEKAEIFSLEITCRGSSSYRSLRAGRQFQLALVMES